MRASHRPLPQSLAVLVLPLAALPAARTTAHSAAVPPAAAAERFDIIPEEVLDGITRAGGGSFELEPGTESGAIHTPTFRAADGSVPVGMRAMTHLVVDYLTGWE